MTAPGTPQTWDQKHAADFKLIHEALFALTKLDFQGTAHTDWIDTVRAVREKVTMFSMFVPNSAQLLVMLDTAERVLLAVGAVSNLAKDA